MSSFGGITSATKAISGADERTDHRFDISKMTIRLQPRRRPRAKGTAPIFSADGTTLLTEKVRILQRLAEHFGGNLNYPSTVSDIVIARLPQEQTNADLDLLPLYTKPSRPFSSPPAEKCPDRT
nr:unnamed protein product [Spirometra erinaceieuropaei]